MLSSFRKKISKLIAYPDEPPSELEKTGKEESLQKGSKDGNAIKEAAGHPQPGHRIFGVSVIGPLHVINNIPCQDACAFETLSPGFGIIAVADGLGSATRSEIGATIAVGTAVNKVKEIIINKKIEEIDLEDAAKEAISFARKELEEKADELQCKLRDLACTIIVVIMHKDSVAVAHIGDGAVVAKTNEGLKLISGPEDSEYANEVSPLTGKDWEQVIRITSQVSGISGVMAFTDGCHRAVLRKTPDGLIPFAGFCEPIFSYAKNVKDIKKAEEDIKELLLSKKVCENSEDDKTLVIAILDKG